MSRLCRGSVLSAHVHVAACWYTTLCLVLCVKYSVFLTGIQHLPKQVIYSSSFSIVSY